MNRILKIINIFCIVFPIFLLTSCNTNEHVHKYEVKFDETKHWTECSCGEKTELITHAYGEWQSDETGHWLECSCGRKGQTIIHAYTVYKNDENNHWLECICGYHKGDSAPHYYFDANYDDDNHWVECHVCGRKNELSEHDYDEWYVNEIGHWKYCGCGYKSEVEEHIPSSPATTESSQVCTICDYEIEIMLGHNHDFKVINKIDAEIGKDGQIAIECSCGRKETKTLHYYEWFKCINCKRSDSLKEEIVDVFCEKFADKHFELTGKDLDNNEVKLYYYYGEYNGSYVINISSYGNYYEKEWLVENETLEYENLKELSVYHDGIFYSLTEALEMNLITSKDIENIIEWDKLYYPAKYYTLSEEEIEYIKAVSGYTSINNNWFKGKFGDAYVIGSNSGFASCYLDTINNVTVLYHSSASFMVIYNNQKYTLKEAFVNLILTEEDINKLSLINIKFDDLHLENIDEVDGTEPIKLEEKIKSDITEENIGTSLIITIDKNFQLLLTEEHFKNIEFESLNKIESDSINQQYLMTFKTKEDAYIAFTKLEKLYYVLNVNNK